MSVYGYSVLMVKASSEDLEKPVVPRSLTRAFTARTLSEYPALQLVQAYLMNGITQIKKLQKSFNCLYR